MIHLFRSNIPWVLLALPLVLASIWLPQALDDSRAFLYDGGSPLSRMMGGVWVNGALLTALFGILLLVAAYLINLSFNVQDFLDRQTYLPGLFTLLFISMVPNVHVHVFILLAMLFVLLAYASLSRMRQGMTSLQIVIPSSIFLSAALLCSVYAIAIIPIIWIHLAVFRPFVWREWIWSLVGTAIIPLNVWGLAYGLKGRSFAELFNWHAPNTPVEPPTNIKITLFLLWLGMLLFALVFIVLKYRRSGLRFRRLIKTAWLCVLYLIFTASFLIVITGSYQFLVYPLSIAVIPVSWAYAQVKSSLVPDILAYVMLGTLLVEKWKLF